MSDTHPKIKSGLIDLLGIEIYTPDSVLDKKKLASIIFSNRQLLLKVNEIIHPIVREHFLEWCAIHSKQTYIIKEAAILFESGAYKDMDYSVSVIAPQQTRINRVKQRDTTNQQQVLARMKNQMTDIDRIKKSDFIINNDNQLVTPQVVKLHNYFSSQH